jgi:hypothetical protein
MKIMNFIGVFLITASLAFAGDDSRYLFFTKIDSETSHSIPIMNDTSAIVTDITASVDCGCVKLRHSPSSLLPGEVQYIDFSSIPMFHEQRKVNNLVVQGSPDFLRKICIVNYFYSDHPQIFGNTIIHLRELGSKNAVNKIAIIGTQNISLLNVFSQCGDAFTYSLSKPVKIANGGDCYKRIMIFSLNSKELLQEGKEMVYVRAAAENNNLTITDE